MINPPTDFKTLMVLAVLKAVLYFEIITLFALLYLSAMPRFY